LCIDPLRGEGSTSTKTHEKPAPPARNAISGSGSTFSLFRPFMGTTTVTVRRATRRDARTARSD
jgi:hypothetical protein